MSNHPYLRAYMAGAMVPTVFMLFVLTMFCVARFVYHVPVPIERVIVFPMAIVPNLFGVWNMLYVALRSRRHLRIGLHGAVLPFILAPLGFAIATSLGFLAATSQGLVWFEVLRIPYLRLGLIFPTVVIVYYLVWKHLIGSLNELLGIAE